MFGTSTYYLKDVSIEQAIEYVLYLVRPAGTTTANGLYRKFVERSVNEAGKNIVTGAQLEESIKLVDVAKMSIMTNNTINVSNINHASGYIIALIRDKTDDNLIFKISTNFVEYYYEDSYKFALPSLARLLINA